MSNRNPPPPPEANQFPPGVSGNPGGRPKFSAVSRAYRKFLELTTEQFQALDIKLLTTAEVIARKQILKAMQGHISAAVETTTRAEGPPKQEVEISQTEASPESVASMLAALGYAVKGIEVVAASESDGGVN